MSLTPKLKTRTIQNCDDASLFLDPQIWDIEKYKKMYGQFVENGLSGAIPNAESGAGIYQYEHTLTPDDFPSGVEGWNFTKIKCDLNVITEKITAGSINLNFRFFINDEAQGTDFRSITDAAPFASMLTMRYNAVEGNNFNFTNDNLKAGDKVQMKIWSASGTFLTRNVFLVLIPVIMTCNVMTFEGRGRVDVRAPLLDVFPETEIQNTGNLYAYEYWSIGVSSDDFCEFQANSASGGTIIKVDFDDNIGMDSAVSREIKPPTTIGFGQYGLGG